MEKGLIRETAARLLSSLLPAAVLCFLGDVAVTVLWGSVPLVVFLTSLAVLTLLFYLPRFTIRRRLMILLVIVLVCALLLAAAGFIWYRFYQSSAYRDVDEGKSAMYSGKKVMIIVPHQDDEVLLADGIIEEFVKYGSEVYLVVVTAGSNGRERMRETLAVMSYEGVDEDNVIFLGFDFGQDSENIYNQQPDKVIRSEAGISESFGLPEHPAYREGLEYSRQNFVNSLRELILEYRPDVILCNDYDYHPAHVTVSFFFEEVMGDILRSEPDYTPEVFKGMAYSTAFDAPYDFYAANIGSTAAPYSVPYLYERPDYQWGARIRFPIDAATVSRSLLGSDQFRALRMYKTQAAWVHAPAAINGDKVFWHRPTGSLCYKAAVSASSGDANMLNNFKLLDSTDIADFGRMPYEGTWVTQPGDSDRSAVFSFPEAVPLSVIRLYDNPDAFHNVLNAEIVFDDGSRIETGPIEYQGAPTDFMFDTKTVSSFTVRILSSEGDCAGLTEVEAYSKSPDTGLRCVKLMNSDDDFVYDYRIDRSGYEEFKLYCLEAPALTAGNYSVRCTGSDCSAVIDGDSLAVSCPRGKSCTVSITSSGGELSDTVYISNPSPLSNIGQNLEAFVWNNYTALQGCAAYRILRAVYHIFRSEHIIL